MTTLTITFDFSSDNGDAELFTEIWTDGGSTWPDGAYDGSEGNPSGSVTSAVTYDGGYTSGSSSIGITKTLSDWGVPSGATVTSIGNVQADVKVTFAGSSPWPGVCVQRGEDFSEIIQYKYPNTALSSDFSWGAVTPLQDDNDQSPYALTDNINICVDLSGSCGGSGDFIDFWYDNISFDIEYFAGTVVTGSGALQAQSATISGTGTSAHVIYGTGSLQALEALIDGYAYYLPGVYETEKTHTSDSFTLTVDGTIIPLFGFTVTRTVGSDTAEVQVPLEYEAEITAAVALTIDITSVDVYGTVTVTELFTGAPDTSAPGYQARDRRKIRARGAGTPAPTNAVREFGNVSYISDDANYFSCRTRIDERFYPGDVGMFGLRRINVNRVTFVVNSTQAFMELTDIGQV
jgi:hypothetical protein